jgi:sulfur-oxidizing protein SoxX
MNKRNKWTLAGLAAAAVVVAGCAALPSGTDLDKLALDVAKASFQDAGPVKTDRLVQDETNRECSAAQTAGVELSAERAKAIEAINMKTIRWPAGGRFLGDWQEGEKIAQSGRGLTWSDDVKTPNGGNCYNCHQIAKEEISFGTIGPSLYNYGKVRGVTDPASPAARPVVEYTWGKIWNAKAYNACSNMPRVGHSGILNEDQVRHVMALLLDPRSSVNK